MAILYSEPRQWIKYDILKVSGALIAAKAALHSLQTVPYQKEYRALAVPVKAFNRDLGSLIDLGAIHATKKEQPSFWNVSVNLAWPSEITESDFFKRLKSLPKGKTYGFLV